MRQKLNIVFLTSLGGALELYDFLVFMIFASSISKAFFPLHSDLARMLSTLSVFAAGYLARPIGGLIFSHFGDRIGRKKTFTLTISLMAFATLSLSLIPSYHQLGLLAPILFIFFRLLQGISIGGEVPGAVTFITEHINKNQGFACSIFLLCLNLGLLLAHGMYRLVNTVFEPEFASRYGFRLAFFLGSILGIIAYYTRRKTEETDAFKCQEKKDKYPILSLLKSYKKEVVLGFISVSLGASTLTLLILYLTTYLGEFLNYSPWLAGQYAFYQMLFFSFLSPFISFLSDYISKYYLIILGAILLLFVPYFSLNALAKKQHILLALSANALAISLITGSILCFLSQLFPTSVRYTGIAFCYNLPFAIMGGVAPLIVTYLNTRYQLIFAEAYMISFLALITLLVFIMAKRPKVETSIECPQLS